MQIAQTFRAFFRVSIAVHVFHRIDDVYACRPDLMRILAGCERLGLAALLAVIPRRLTPEMAGYLSSRPQFAIYQHGSEHKSNALSGRKDEFPSSREFADIVTGVATGRALIEAAIGRPVNGYVPPWNTASPPLLKALTLLGFTHISANRSAVIPDTLVHRPFMVDTLESYTPIRVQAAEVTIAQIEAKGRQGRAVGVVHHIKDLGEPGLQAIETVMNWSVSRRMPHAEWRAFVGQVPTSAA
jgi:hypothetical protein